MPGTRQIVSRSPVIAITILTIGGLAYAILCLPAIGRRGFPPIDHMWMAMTYLWLGPLMLSSLFDDTGSALRRQSLIAYALFTGFVDAATVGIAVPRHVSLLGTMMLTLLYFGPYHLIAAFLIEWVVQRILRIWRTFGPAESDAAWLPQLSLAEWLIGYTIIAATIGFPFAYRSRAIARDRARGQQQADDDWLNHTAQCIAKYAEDSEAGAIRGATVTYEFDRETGLQMHRRGYLGDVSAGYNERITELLREHGVPNWSARPLLISAEDLVALLDSSEGTEILELPFEVTPSITVFKTGTVTKWGSTFSFDGNGGGVTSSGSSPSGFFSSGNAFAIATERDGLRAVGSGSNALFVIDHSPETICLRYGSNWIGLYHRDGRLLQSASR